MYGLDLFSGIGGLTKALAGYVQPVAYCEIDPYARGVLLSRIASGELPDVPIWDDVSSLRGAMLPRVDIIYGGFPCQDLSVAGRGAGLEGKRSGLFFEIIRLTKEIRPTFVFLENVPAIRRRGLDRVLEEFTGNGYDCRWGMLSAADVGANHKRERWWLLAHTRRTGCQKGMLRHKGNDGCSSCKGRSIELTESSEASAFVADSGGQSSPQKDTSVVTIRKERNTRADDRRSNGRPISRNDWWVLEPNVDRMAHGIPFRVERSTALGNAVVPAQAREAFERLIGIK